MPVIHRFGNKTVELFRLNMGGLRKRRAGENGHPCKQNTKVVHFSTFNIITDIFSLSYVTNDITTIWSRIFAGLCHSRPNVPFGRAGTCVATTPPSNSS
jgi:hypothetical protein